MTGLNLAQKALVRRRLKRAALLGVSKRQRIHYTQGAKRWFYINQKIRAYKGEVPSYADCSAYVTGLYWDACLRYIRSGKIRRDFINGADWKAGYTGTQIRHGQRIHGTRKVGDLVFYAGTNGVINHVAIYVGSGKVVSFGSDPGPLLLPVNYRVVAQTRRYL
jgi:hypothetical protein